jgi:hypothetical protein
MSPDDVVRTQGTFEFKRMVWPYVVTTGGDGTREVEVRDAICPRCRGRASYQQIGENVLLSCRRCSISSNYSPFSSYDELKEHVAGLTLESLED